jgi:hypothetical protein
MTYKIHVVDVSSILHLIDSKDLKRLEDLLNDDWRIQRVDSAYEDKRGLLIYILEKP